MTTENSSWATEGFEGLRSEEMRIATQYGPNRVWIPVGGSRELVFLDDNPLCFDEHNAKINGDWKNWITCLKAVSQDVPVCCEILGARSHYYVGYFTVVDCTKWTDKKGNTYQFEVKLLQAKLKTLKKFELKKKDRGSLVGCVYKVTRADEKASAVGDDYEFQREADLTKLYDLANYKGKKMHEHYSKAVENEDAMKLLKHTFKVQLGQDGRPTPKLVPFNYNALFAPKSAKDVKAMLAGVQLDDRRGGSGGGSAGGAEGEEEIPF